MKNSADDMTPTIARSRTVAPSAQPLNGKRDMMMTNQPGKFESEPAYAEYFWQLVLDGEGEPHTFWADDDPECECEPIAEFYEFVVDAEESERFAAERGYLTRIQCGDYVIVWEDRQGFVNSRVFESQNDMFAYFNDYLGL